MTDGCDMQTGLVYANGNLYGESESCGAYGEGTVFELSLSGQERILHDFAGGNDGREPYDGPLAYANGTLYGTARLGGAYDWGTVYSITPDGQYKTLHSFGSTGDGAEPASGVVYDNGQLYGVTRDPAVVFSVNASTGEEHVLYTASKALKGDVTIVGDTLYATTLSPNGQVIAIPLP